MAGLAGTKSDRRQNCPEIVHDRRKPRFQEGLGSDRKKPAFPIPPSTSILEARESGKSGCCAWLPADSLDVLQIAFE